MHGHHRAEDFLSGTAAARGQARDDRGRQVESCPGAARSSRQDLAAFLDGEGEVSLDLVAVRFGDHWTDWEIPDGVDKAGQEVVVQRRVHQHAGAAQADLPRVQEACADHAGQHHVKVGVIEDDGGVLAAQLEAEFLEHRSRGRGDDASGCGAAGEGNGRDARVFDDGLTDLWTEPMQHVEQACRKARFKGQFTEAMRGQGRDFGGLRDDGVSHEQGRRDLPREQIQREVPRRDQTDHADGFAKDVVHGVVHREGLLRRGSAQFGKKAEVAHAPVNVHVTGHVPWLPCVE